MGAIADDMEREYHDSPEYKAMQERKKYHEDAMVQLKTLTCNSFTLGELNFLQDKPTSISRYDDLDSIMMRFYTQERIDRIKEIVAKVVVR